ncbi:putative cation efflux pump [Novosphingobium sp. Rr 2-17]|nr:putative cation efflux pump [Novosphingobium sp. Rr 2-17]
MLTNVATALFGLADMWAIGRLGDAPAQGAVELGAKFMMGLLNVFNFLRAGTVALTAQGVGRGETHEMARGLARAMTVALGLGAVLLLAMPLAIPFGLDLLGAHGTLRDHTATYVTIRYWAAPLWLANCVLTGWLIGRQRVRAVLAVEVSANAVHIALDLVLVLVAHWGIAGVAVATLSSEALKALLLATVVFREREARTAWFAFRERATWQRNAMTKLFALNRDLFLRTLLLTVAMFVFARVGAQNGPVTLAANAILFQLFMLSVLLLDGFESAAQVLCGQAIGAGDRASFAAAMRANLIRGGFVGVGVSAAYGLGSASLASWFSTDPQVVAASARYAGWLALLPMLGVASFVLDGVFIGAGWTRAMALTMTAALALYLGLLWALAGMGNDGLWIAFIAFFLARAAGQAWLLPGLLRRSFRPA